MKKNLLLVTIIFICEVLIYSANDECSVLSCSSLNADTGKKCFLTSTGCIASPECSSFTTEETCTSNAYTIQPLTSKCAWKSGQCSKVDIPCSEYSQVKVSGVICKDLKATSPMKCYLKNANEETEACIEEGCSGANQEECEAHFPINDNGEVDNLKKCVFENNQCLTKFKECQDHESNDDCISLKASDPSTKKCILTTTNPIECKEEIIKCEGYTYTSGTTNQETECEAITSKIEISDPHLKCTWKNNQCITVKKECNDIEIVNDGETSINQDKANICISHVLDDQSKRCYIKENICKEQYKTCKSYSDNVSNKNENDCKDIVEDSSSKCVLEGNNCVKKQRSCNDNDLTSATCNFRLNDTHVCKYESTCKEAENYITCSKYTGNDTEKCESIVPPESNMKCILKEDSRCTLITKECEEYIGNKEDECINNYKPLDDNYECSFKLPENGSNKQCLKWPKAKEGYCSDYRGSDKTICESIIPINKGETYSIKCYFENGKCIRKEVPCSEGNDAIQCASIIPKNHKKICKYLTSSGTTTCTEQHKTCEDFNGDKSVESNYKNICENIISIDGKICSHQNGNEENPMGTCSGQLRVCDEFDRSTFPNICESIPLNDMTKKCVYTNNGDCKMETKSCLELVFNGNESGIEEKCRSIQNVGENNVCVLRSDRRGCIIIDKSKDSKTPSSSSGSNKNPSKSQGSSNSGTTGTNKKSESEQGNDNNSGKDTYINKLLIIILCLLF